MIDLGLTKLAVIGAVALVVIGPERLPKVARMAGTLFGRAQRYMNSVKEEVNREMQMEEMRAMQESLRSAASDLNKTVAGEFAEAGKELGAALGEAEGAYTDWSGMPGPDQLAQKRRNFRRRKVAQASALPLWYKRQNGRKTHVISGAARVARFRPVRANPVRFFE